MKSKLLILVVFCIFYAGISVAEEKKETDNMSVEPDNTPIAIGDGFVLTQNEVNEYRNFVEKKTNMRTLEKEYRRFALMIRLFAEEAKAIGLGQKEIEDSFDNRSKLCNLYAEKVIKDYKPDDLVIESYYFAKHDKFKTESGESKPLNDEVKKEIREIVVKEMPKKLHNRAVEQLKQKYHVRLCDTDKGGCQR